jgi:hypothetical protein
MIRKTAVSAILVLLLSGCGGSPAVPVVPTPVDPSIPVGTVFTFVFGDTQSPVAGATVTLAGRPYMTDASGRIQLQEKVLPDALIDVMGPNVLDRISRLRSNTVNRFVIWPRETPSGLNLHYTANLVYTAGTAEPPPVGSTPLLRLRSGTTQVVVVPSAEIQADDEAMRMHELAVERLTAASGGAVRYVLASSRPASGVVVEDRIDPSDPGCVARRIRGQTSWQVSASYEVVGASILYCGIDIARTGTVVHELGHSFGLHHSPDAVDVMGIPYTRQRATDFGPRETVTMRLILERRGGNRFPDNDRELAGGALGATVTIGCP